MLQHNEKGLTLIEVVASIVIITIILVTLLNIFPLMGKSNNQTKEKQQAINLAKGELINWQNIIPNDQDIFDDFLLNPDTFISEDETFEQQTDTLIIRSETQASAINYFVNVIISKNPDPINSSNNAYQIKIQLFKDKNNNIPVTETYGYIFTEGG